MRQSFKTVSKSRNQGHQRRASGEVITPMRLGRFQRAKTENTRAVTTVSSSLIHYRGRYIPECSRFSSFLHRSVTSHSLHSSTYSSRQSRPTPIARTQRFIHFLIPATAPSTLYPTVRAMTPHLRFLVRVRLQHIEAAIAREVLNGRMCHLMNNTWLSNVPLHPRHHSSDPIVLRTSHDRFSLSLDIYVGGHFKPNSVHPRLR